MLVGSFLFQSKDQDQSSAGSKNSWTIVHKVLRIGRLLVHSNILTMIVLKYLFYLDFTGLILDLDILYLQDQDNEALDMCIGSGSQCSRTSSMFRGSESSSARICSEDQSHSTSSNVHRTTIIVFKDLFSLDFYGMMVVCLFVCFIGSE